MSAALGALARGWNRFFFSGCNAETLGALRIVVGFGLILHQVLNFYTVFELDPFGPHFYFTDPIWYFKALGIHWLHPLAAQLGFVAMLAATVAFALGIRTRLAALAMLVLIFYLKGMRDSVAGDVHHRYLMPAHMLFFFLLSRCGELMSFDARRAAAAGRPFAPLQEWEASWPIKASQLYICSFYLWSALAKWRMTGFGWASGERIQGLLLSRSSRWVGDQAWFGSGLAAVLGTSPLLCDLLGAATFAFEFGFPLVLLIRSVRLRLLFFAGITSFHVANYVLISVKFLFLPVIFPLFFDLAPIVAWFRARRGGASTPVAPKLA